MQSVGGSRAGARHRPCSLRRGGADRMSGLPDIRHFKTLPSRLSPGLPLIPGTNAEGTARRSARLPFKCAPCFPRCGAFRRAITASFLAAPGRAFFGPSRFCPGPEGRTSWALAPGRGLRTPDRPLNGPPSAKLLAGTRSGPGRSPGAARVRGYEPRPRAPRSLTFRSGPECADGCSPPPSASRLLHHRDVSRRRPQPSKAAWNKILDCGDSMTIFL